MRKKVHKWFWAWDFDKEEKWLNEMSDKGWAMVGYSFCTYEFEKTEPQAYTYRLELLENAVTHPESQAYLEFLEETGAEQVASYMRWVYLRKKREYGEFELFSDFDSRVTHLKRIIALLLPLGLFNFANGLHNINMEYSSANVLLGSLCVVISLLCFAGCFRLRMKIKKLEKERQIYES